MVGDFHKNKYPNFTISSKRYTERRYWIRNHVIRGMLFNLLHLDDVVTSLQSQASFPGIPSSNLEICDVWNTGKHLFISTTEGHKLYTFDLSGSQSRPSLNEAIFLDESTSSVVNVLVHPSAPHYVLVVRMNSITALYEYFRLERRWIEQCKFQLSNAKGSQVTSVLLQGSSFALFWCENRSISGPGLSSCCVCRRQLASTWDGSLSEQLGQVEAILHSSPVVSLYTIQQELCIIPSLPHKEQLMLFWSPVRRNFKVYVYGHDTVEEIVDKVDFRVIYSEFLSVINYSIALGHFVSFATHVSTQELVTIDNHGDVSLVNSPEKQNVVTPLCCLKEHFIEDQVDKIFVYGLFLICIGHSGKIYFFHTESGILLETLDILRDKNPCFWFGVDELPKVGLFTSDGIWKLLSTAVLDIAAFIEASAKYQKTPSSSCVSKSYNGNNETEVINFDKTQLDQTSCENTKSDTSQRDSCTCEAYESCKKLIDKKNSFTGTKHAINFLSFWNNKHWSAKIALDSVISALVFNESSRIDCEIPCVILDLLAGEHFQNPSLLLALLWDHPIHRGFVRRTVQEFINKYSRSAAKKTSLNKMLHPYLEEFKSLSKKYDVTLRGDLASDKEDCVECILPASVEGKIILSNLNDQFDSVMLRRLSILADQSPEQLLISVSDFLDFESSEFNLEGEHLMQWWRKLFRLEWKGGQWRKQKLNLSNYQNSLLRILCQLFYQFQPDRLPQVVDKGLETLHSDESLVDLSSLGKSYKDFISHSVIECLPRLTTEKTRSDSVVVQAELLLYPGQETEALRLLLQHSLWSHSVDFVSTCDNESRPLLFIMLLKAFLRGRAPSIVFSRALELIPDGFPPHEVLRILRDYAPSTKSPFPESHNEVKLGDVRGHLELLLAPK